LPAGFLVVVRAAAAPWSLLLIAFGAATTSAQTTSLYAPPQAREYAPRDLESTSWTYVAPPPVRTFKLNDMVTIRVEEQSRMQSRGDSQVRRNALLDGVIRDWISLDGFKLQAAEFENGDPRMQTFHNNTQRLSSVLESREALAFNIAARIVDIRPNGHLVLEAHKSVFNNEDVWETSLSGLCRPDDVGPDNTVLSQDVMELKIDKHEQGQLRDGYRRGWFMRWFAKMQPF
jgi:flagellar L-ring protein precursor FlgH